MSTVSSATERATEAECIDCGAALAVEVRLPGEILDCPDCGIELEVRSVTPLVLAAAPEVEEDWGE
jgi:alpha-aminoadipate carrier protein LysW